MNYVLRDHIFKHIKTITHVKTKYLKNQRSFIGQFSIIEDASVNTNARSLGYLKQPTDEFEDNQSNGGNVLSAGSSASINPTHNDPNLSNQNASGDLELESSDKEDEPSVSDNILGTKDVNDTLRDGDLLKKEQQTVQVLTEGSTAEKGSA